MHTNRSLFSVLAFASRRSMLGYGERSYSGRKRKSKNDYGSLSAGKPWRHCLRCMASYVTPVLPCHPSDRPSPSILSHLRRVDSNQDLLLNVVSASSSAYYVKFVARSPFGSEDAPRQDQDGFCTLNSTCILCRTRGGLPTMECFECQAAGPACATDWQKTATRR